MEIVFFVAKDEEAYGVASSDDLLVDVATDPIEADGPEALTGLATALGLQCDHALHQLRDATCRSYPIWVMSEAMNTRIANLDGDEIDRSAEAWRPRQNADLYERTHCLAELGEALRGRGDGERLFALFEERAF